MAKWRKRLLGAVGTRANADSLSTRTNANDIWFFQCQMGGNRPIPSNITIIRRLWHLISRRGLTPAQSSGGMQDELPVRASSNRFHKTAWRLCYASPNHCNTAVHAGRLHSWFQQDAAVFYSSLS